MTRDDLQPLSSGAQRLLAHEREIPPAPADLRARVMARAENVVQVSEVAPPRVLRRVRPVLLAAALVATLAAASFAAWLGRSAFGTDQATVKSGAVERAAPSVPTSKPMSVPEQAPGPEAPEAVEQEVARPGEKGAQAPRRAPAVDVDALELAILQRARAAVARGDFASAIEALRDHQRRFPRGKLGEEREALRVKALAGLGRHDDARRAAERFRERFPDSVLSPRIEGTQGAP
jgi:TolA-binding protein